MPLREHYCPNASCEISCVIVEEYFARRDEGPPPCQSCGTTMVRVGSRFAVIFTGKLGGTKYNDPKKDGYRDEGQWVMTRRTPDGKPRHVRLETFQDQREFCKREGLRNPGDMPSNSEVSADGKQLQWKGMPGQWY